MSTTTLTKIINISYTPGSPAVAGSPGTAAAPAYSVTTTTYTTVENGSYQIDTSKNAGSGGSYFFVPNGTYTQVPVTTTTYYPATVYSPPVAAIAAVAPGVNNDYNPGWNTGAITASSITGDGVLTFVPSRGAIGVVVGLTDTYPGVDYTQVKYGITVQHGQLAPIENGVLKSPLAAYTEGNTLAIQRRGGSVTYLSNGVVFYTSTVSSVGTLIGAGELYFGGDAIVAQFATVLYSGSTSAASIQPLKSYAYNGTHREAINAMLPATTAIGGHARVGVAASMLPLVSFAANKKTANAAVSMLPATGRGSAGQIKSKYAVSSTALPYVLTAGHMQTGGLLHGNVSMLPLVDLAANHPYGASSVALQALTVSAGTTARINAYALLNGPSKYRLSASGGPAFVNTFAGVMPFSLLAYGNGGGALLTMPSPTLVIAATNVPSGSATMAMPSGTLAASGTDGGIGEADLTYRTAVIVTAGSGSVLAVSLYGTNVGNVLASGTAGGISTATLKLPLYSLVASGTVNGLSSAVLAMPMIAPTPSGLAFMLAPSARLVAIGTAVVAVTTEAYAMQMIIDPKDQTPVRAVTHYSAYPFTQIIRYGNLYYGVAMDGLYQLDGPDDAGVVIPWAMKTGLDDFADKQLKRVSSLYIDGRLDTTSTIDVFVGESEDDVYTYSVVSGKNIQNYRVPTGKGMRSRYYGLGISDATGHQSEVDSVDIEIDSLQRAI